MSTTQPIGEVVKEYPSKGEWTLNRLQAATPFICGQCQKEKKAKLVAIRNGLWDELSCNGCYGEKLAGT